MGSGVHTLAFILLLGARSWYYQKVVATGPLFNTQNPRAHQPKSWPTTGITPKTLATLQSSLGAQNDEKSADDDSGDSDPGNGDPRQRVTTMEDDMNYIDPEMVFATDCVTSDSDDSDDPDSQ